MKKKNGSGSIGIGSKNAVSRVRKYFPSVNHVRDATDTIKVAVRAADSRDGKKNDPGNCALARACRRELAADGAIIGIGFSYVIKGDVATRYKTSVGVAREITSFDRHQDFAIGADYILSRVPPASRLGRHERDGRTARPVKSPHSPVAVHHKTVRVRVVARN